MSRRPRLAALTIWLAVMAVLALIIARSQFTADMSVFLPRNPTPEQRLLVDQLRDGMVSRLILVGISGGDAETRGRVSQAMAAALHGDARFVSVNNGESGALQEEQRWLFDNRYLLSPAVTPARFSTDGLRAALTDTLNLLASPAGMLVKPLVTRDPTGELMQLLQRLDPGTQPARDPAHGVWITRDGETALMLALTRAAGSDIDAQEAAMGALQREFETARGSAAAATPLRLEMTGPGVFAVESRATIKREVERIAVLGAVLTVGFLLAVYRSLTVLLLGMLPVVTGTLAGVAAVSLGFGVVHGLTLGFGTTLIGEAVDYAIYLFVRAGRGPGTAAEDDDPDEGRDGFWATIRLGLLTSVAGFAALFASGFPGLAQLGLYSIAGLIAAVLVTRYLLPTLLPADFRLRDVRPLGLRLAALANAAGRLPWLVVALAAGAAAVLALRHDGLWNSELLALSPVPMRQQELDMRLRTEMGAPDVRYLVVVDGADTETTLRAVEALAPRLDALQADGVIAGWDAPTRYLPSLATQAARRAALPAREELAARLHAATAELPLRAERLTPFLDEIDAARQRPPLTPESMAGSSLGLPVQAMLIHTEGGVRALLPLRAPEDGTDLIDAGRVRAALAGAGDGSAPLFLDLKQESDALYANYLREAIRLALGGVAAVVVLLLVFLRSPRQVLRVVTPLAAAVLVVTAGLALAGKQLILLHLVGMLLIVAVGSNYTLFFNRADGRMAAPRTLASLFFANCTTVCAFGLLAFSEVPVLQAIGITVGPGAVLALVFSAMLGSRGDARAVLPAPACGR
ncbi:hypothetical protein dqs_0269 [Azoarcus olearius]|uniref:MMPL family transporter n=1 Tax=Azoarcus sp. (strain BH72) TaxID=418699 RepID=UPI000806265F|nr:MMPL family transporter [Azoarcus olearius]ANQ83346.1 hypothetical protein dqs_0269 [Azoarcus olearius]